LTVEAFDQLVPSFEEAFQERMQQWCLDGKKRRGRAYTAYANSPLPTAEDRLLFILVYLKTNPLQVMQGEVFGLPQNKANQWIHTVLPVLQETLRRLGDAPARSMEELAKLLEYSCVQASPEPPSSLPSPPLESEEPLSAPSTPVDGARPLAQEEFPLFAADWNRTTHPAPQRCG
jgi:DDE superfamily endonuclease